MPKVDTELKALYYINRVKTQSFIIISVFLVCCYSVDDMETKKNIYLALFNFSLIHLMTFFILL